MRALGVRAGRLHGPAGYGHLLIGSALLGSFFEFSVPGAGPLLQQLS